jgi:non-homologous end joining protein Ku
MNENSFIVDRIEENIVVLENSNGDIINIDLRYIDEIPSEGDVLVKVDNVYKIDKEATLKRKSHISKLMKGMWSNE